ncbi:MAG: hypothetical protein JNK46_14090 [Methylobacteriaceae bacterium]|nr:hypothetical protein [Methylobacteriaceae bacterium]
MARKMLAWLAFLVLTTVSAAAECRYGPVTFCDGCTLQRSITVPRNEACEFVGYIQNGSFRGFDVVERPKRGSFGVHSPTFAAYRAGAKSGADRFVYRVKWEVGGRPHVATIVNTVTITD